jgi:hypothetical protein
MILAPNVQFVSGWETEIVISGDFTDRGYAEVLRRLTSSCRAGAVVRPVGTSDASSCRATFSLYPVPDDDLLGDVLHDEKD